MEGALILSADAQRPLHGMQVIELAHIMAGPVCGLMLADMGADVVKVEKIAGGDDSRRMLPPDINGESAAFMMVNRNKRGIAVDLKKPEGKDVVRRLIASADCVIENFRHDTMRKLGLDYETLKTINPGLIYCEISGFGRSGPYAQRGGFDLIAQGMSGLMSITGESADRPPVKVGAPITDITAGILAAMGCAAAYAQKLQTGQGQRVDTSLFEAGIVQTYWQSAIGFATGDAPGPLGSAHPLNAPYQAFRTQDGWITVGAANQTNWIRLLDVLQADELADDERFLDNAGRMANLDALQAVLSGYFAQRTTAQWCEAFARAGLPAGPVLDIQEMHRDEHALAREMIVETDHPVAGKVQGIGAPVKFHESVPLASRPAPMFGQHTREVLAELGMDEAQIHELIEDKCVAAGGFSALPGV
ncbi:MAG: CoA transferase [Gammaproteobacteria bacterium]|nr:CoA transferase [Gammaproteobacteria bacterium]